MDQLLVLSCKAQGFSLSFDVFDYLVNVEFGHLEKSGIDFDYLRWI